MKTMNKPIHYVTNRLKLFRSEKDYTQEDLAAFLSLQTGRQISRETIVYWENQTRGLTAETALEVSKATGIAVQDLFERKNAE